MIYDLGMTFNAPDQDLSMQIRPIIRERPLDIVFLSHAHPDHANIEVVEELYDRKLCTEKSTRRRCCITPLFKMCSVGCPVIAAYWG